MSNWQSKTIFTGDNLHVMRGMNSDSVDLIYLDPPFNSNRTYAAPIGSEAAGAAFKDTWTLSDVDLIEHNKLKTDSKGIFAIIETARHTHSKGMFSYLVMMATRLVEMKRILKPTGSIYLHCDPTAGHYLKILMDAIFGTGNFRNEIVWCYRGGGVPKRDFARKHDTIFRYALSDEITFNVDRVRIPYSTNSMERLEYEARAFRGDKVYEGYRPNEKGKHPEDWWNIQPIMPSSKERLGYPTQKPLALLERIIEASSNEGDIVFDPFCGCATTLVASDQLKRGWVGIDISPKAVELVVERIKKSKGLFWEIIPRADIPMRTDVGPELTALEKKAHKGALFALQDQKCNGCKTWFGRLEDFEMDHITPKSLGGTDHKENFQLLCGNCNRKKGKKRQETFMAEMAASKTDVSWLGN